MNIAIFTDTFLPKIDGVAISVDHFCRYLSARGHKFIICCPKYGPDDIKVLGDDIEILRFKNAPLPSYPDIKVVLPSQKKIQKAVKGFKADLIHIQTPGLLGQYGVMASRMYDVPLVGTYHTLFEEYLHHYVPWLPRRSLRFAARRFSVHQCHQLSAVVAPSSAMTTALTAYGVRSPIATIATGLSLTHFVAQTAGGEFRERHGDFETVAALRDVKGVGEAVLIKNADKIVLE